MRSGSSAISCQAALHGCLPADTPQPYSVAARPTGSAASSSYQETNPLCPRLVVRVRGLFVSPIAGRHIRPTENKEKPMARVKRGTKRHARRKKYLKRTKGFYLTKSKLYQSAQEAANRADRYAKRDRRVKKREYRKLWIQRIGAAARNNGLTYGQLIHGRKAAGVSLDRKILADIAVKAAAAFTSLVASAKAAAPPQAKAKKS